MKDPDSRSTYPNSPGWKARETSKAAAEEMVDAAETLRRRALMNLVCWGPATADEVAARMGENILAVRPRLSEPALKRLVIDSGERRKNKSGKSAIVWRASEPQS